MFQVYTLPNSKNLSLENFFQTGAYFSRVSSLTFSCLLHLIYVFSQVKVYKTFWFFHIFWIYFSILETFLVFKREVVGLRCNKIGYYNPSRIYKEKKRKQITIERKIQKKKKKMAVITTYFSTSISKSSKRFLCNVDCIGSNSLCSNKTHQIWKVS